MPGHHGTGYESPAGLYVPDIVRVERVTSCGFIGVTNVTIGFFANLLDKHDAELHSVYYKQTRPAYKVF